jgi:hypothetical protein
MPLNAAQKFQVLPHLRASMQGQMLVALSALCCSLLAGSFQAKATMTDTNETASLRSDFLQAVAEVEKLRTVNRSDEIDCTQYFAKFHRYSDIRKYKLFFQAYDVRQIVSNINGHHVGFQFSKDMLRALGYAGFYRGDRLVLAFRTKSAESNEIIWFRVSLLNSDWS